MKNTSKIIRKKHDKDSHYTCISNEILQSKTLSTDEKSVLVHLLSLPETWTINKTTIWKQMNIGRERFNKAWTGLEKEGYVVSKKLRGKNNLIVGYHHVVYEEPLKLKSGLPETGEPENQSPQEPVRIESNEQEYNNRINNNEKNNKSGTNIRTSTGPDTKFDISFLNTLSIEKIQDEYQNYSNNLHEIKVKIIKASKIGTIAINLVESDLPRLERAIGADIFEQVKPLISQYFELDLICKQIWKKLCETIENQTNSQHVNEVNLLAQHTTG